MEKIKETEMSSFNFKLAITCIHNIKCIIMNMVNYNQTGADGKMGKFCWIDLKLIIILAKFKIFKSVEFLGKFKKKILSNI